MVADESKMPWVLLGDFNALSSTEDRYGAFVRVSEIVLMLECMNYCQISDVKANGRLFSRNDKQEGDRRMYSRINRVLATQEWVDLFDLAEVSFMPKGDYEHTSMLLCIYPECNVKKPFKFHNMWCQHNFVIEVVKEAWSKKVKGCPMFIVFQKVKLVNQTLKELNRSDIGDIEVVVVKTRKALMDAQDATLKQR